MSVLSCWLLLLVSVGVEQAKEESITVYRGARIHTAVGGPIEGGVLVVQGGRILAVGAEGAVAVPQGAVVRDLTGKTIIPGLVDTHSHVGLMQRPAVAAHQDGNEMTGPVQPALRALDAIWPGDPGFRMAVAGGVTTANIMPGSGNVIGGQTLYVKLRGDTVEIMRVEAAGVSGGLKMANGENPKSYGRRGTGQAPATRMKVAALQREQFAKARAYQQKWHAYRREVAEGKKLLLPETDLALEPLVEVLERKRTVHFHCHRMDDLMTALRIQEEFGFELVLQHATEAYRVADELVRRKVPVSLTLVDSPGGKFEVLGLLEENAAILEKAGVKVCINTDDAVTESRFFLRTGAIAVRGGMSEEAALRALTLHGAQVMHLDHRLGSLQPGRDADFVVLSGPPFSVYTHVLETYIDGKKVFDRSRHEDWTYQAGGYALGDPDRLPKPPPPARPLPTVGVPDAGKAVPPRNATRYAVLAGRVHTVSHGTIADGIVLVENGKIAAVGPRGKVALAPDTPILTAAVVTPGLIDAHSVIGVSGRLNVPADQDQDEMGDPNQADLRVLDSFNPNEPFLRFVREQGVTLVHAMPGRANVIAGQTGIFRTYGRSAEQMAVRSPAAILINLGENPKQAYSGRRPNTRMGTAALIRGTLAEAAEHQQRRANPGTDKAPPLNPKLAALGPAVAGKLPVVFSAHRADDLQTALRLSKEFNLRAMIGLATEGYLVADALAEAGVPVLLHPTMQRGSSLETVNAHLGSAAALAGRKVPVALGTAFESYVPKTRVLRHEAAIAMAHGLGHDRALAAITLDAAKILGVDERFGSVEVGKVADLVLYDGDPFEFTTHVTHTILDGRVVWDRAEYLKLPFARRVLPLVSGDGGGCCLGIW